jgi:predicted LPLAT superfamily acyltransferase
MIRVAVVIPSKDNVGTIADVVARSLVHCEHIFVVDDGCVDGTGAAAKAAGAVVLTHPVNLGKGAALLTAFRRLVADGFSHAICLDADGQHMPEEIPLFERALRREPLAIQLGVRDMSTAPGVSTFGRNFSNFWVWAETGHPVGDSQSGFRSYPVVETLALGMGGGRYEMEVEVLVRAMWRGIPVRDIDISVFYPDPEDRVSSFRPLHDNVRISWMNTKLVVRRLIWPPRWINRLPAPPPLDSAEDLSYEAGKWTGQTKGSLRLYQVAFSFMRVLPRLPCYALLLGISFFYLLTGGPSRRGLDAFLSRVRPDLGALGRLIGIWRIFWNFSMAIHDRFRLLFQGPEFFTFVREGGDAVRALLPNEGIVMLTTHVGNADMAGVALKSEGGPSRQINQVRYQAVNDTYATLLKHSKSSGAPNFITLNSSKGLASLGVVHALRRGEVVAMHPDRVVDDRRVRVMFLGEEIELATGPFLMAALAGASVVTIACFKETPWRYRVVAAPPRKLVFTSRKMRQADLQRWAQDYATQLEEWVHRYPWQWYNFHDPWALAARSKAEQT